MQERHLSGMAVVYERLMGVLQKADDHIPVDRAALAIRETILAERDVAMLPITPDLSGPASGAAPISMERSVKIEDMRRFECTPEMLAATVRILEQYETREYPPDPDPNGDDDGDAPRDAEPSSPAATHSRFAALPEADGAV